jgi:hypothetical protein
MWPVTVALGAFSALLIVMNWCGVLYAVSRGRNYSPIPLVGGIVGCAALLLCPASGIWRFAWVPLVLDYSVPGLLYAAFVLGAFRR